MPIFDINKLKEEGYFGKLDKGRIAALSFPLSYSDWQENKTDPILENTNWIKEAVRHKGLMNENKFKVS